MIEQPDRCLTCGRPLRHQIEKQGDPPKAVVVLTHKDDGTRPCFVLETEWDDRMPESVRESLKPYLEEALSAVADRNPKSCSVVYAADPATSSILRVTTDFADGSSVARSEPLEKLATRSIDVRRFFE